MVSGPATPWKRRHRSIAMLAVAIVLTSCEGDSTMTPNEGGAEHCIKPLALDCTPTFEPSYDGIYESLLRPMCATGSVCHYGPTPDKAQAGLVLSNLDDAYDYLLGKTDGRARVIPDKPECSILVQRLESNDPSFRMPKLGAQLELGDRCVVRKWIARGAKR